MFPKLPSLANIAIALGLTIAAIAAFGTMGGRFYGAGMVDGWNLAVESCLRDRAKCTRTELAPQ